MQKLTISSHSLADDLNNREIHTFIFFSANCGTKVSADYQHHNNRSRKHQTSRDN